MKWIYAIAALLLMLLFGTGCHVTGHGKVGLIEYGPVGVISAKYDIDAKVGIVTALTPEPFYLFTWDASSGLLEDGN